jgi:Cdc6-like AAA superfamily ATPase
MAYRQLEEKIRESPASRFKEKPEQPIGRQNELSGIREVFAHIGKSSTPLHIWIWGPEGVGKTHCALNLAMTEAENHKAMVAYSNCWKSNSLYALVNDIIDQFGILRAELQDTRFKIERIAKHTQDHQCLFIIDEIDRLDAKERNAVLYQFNDLKNVWIVAISHLEPQKLGIEPRVWSRLSPVTIAFDKYSTEEIVALLTHHSQKADLKELPNPEKIREIAIESEGDFRRAKKLLTQKGILGLSDIKMPTGKIVPKKR